MPHRFLDHTADVAADLDGGSAGELFASALQALTDTMTPLEDVRPFVTQSVTLEAPTLEDLLVDWLNELLYRFEVHNMLFSAADVQVREHDASWTVAGFVSGEPVDPARHPMRVLVKSATYHGLNVVHDQETWRARIVFDI